MRFKKGYFIGAASLAVVALVCSVISVKANPNEGHNNNFSCDANVTFVDNSNVSDAFLNQPATIPNFIPSTEGNIQGNLMTLQEPIIGENTSVQTPSQENNNQQNVQMPEESTGSNETNNQCNGNRNESTVTMDNSNNTGCTGNIVGTSKDVDQSVILYERDLLDSENNDSNISSNTGTGCTTLENTSNNMVSSTTISNNTCENNLTEVVVTNPNAREQATGEVKETTNEATNTNCAEINKTTEASSNVSNKSTTTATTKKNTSNQVYSNVSTNKSTSQSSNNVSKSTSSKETDDADVKLLTGTASDTEGTDVETEDDSSGEIAEDNANEQVPVLKDNIKKDKEAPKTADKLKAAIVVLMLIVAVGIIIMLCIMNRNDVSKEEIKTGFGANTSTN